MNRCIPLVAVFPGLVRSFSMNSAALWAVCRIRLPAVHPTESGRFRGGGVQTLSQIENLYGKAAGAILEGFCSKVFFGGGLAQADARYASELGGVCTVESVTVTETNEVGIEESVRISQTRVPTARAVLLPEEVARPQVHPLLGPPVTLFLPEVPPFYAYLPPAYQTPQLAAALEPIARESQAKDPVVERETKLGVAGLNGPLRKHWQHLKSEIGGKQLGILLDELESLGDIHAHLPQPNGSLLEMFLNAHKDSGTRDLSASLSYLHWKMVLQIEQHRLIEPDDRARVT